MPTDDTAPRLRVCCFESRRGGEMRTMIEKQGGAATIAPSLREIPLEENPQAFAFAEELLAGRIDVMIFLTGVGARGLLEVLELRYVRSDLLAAWSRSQTVVRGPKPAAVLREWKLRIDQQVPEPNTWRELLQTLDQHLPVNGKRVAVQEYGKPNDDFYAELRSRGAEVLPVPVYRWDLPVDLAPLQQAIRDIVQGNFDVLMFTSAQQIHHVLQVAEQLGCRAELLEASHHLLVASIGPTATETLIGEGLPPDLEPSHPKMGHLVVETLQRGADLLAEKRHR